MTMFRAGLAVAMVVIGGIAALLGAILLVSAFSSGSIAVSYGAGAGAVAETITRAGDPDRFMKPGAHARRRAVSCLAPRRPGGACVR